MEHGLELKGREHACAACMRPQDYCGNIITRQDEHLYSCHSGDRRGVQGWLWSHKSEASPDYISPYIKNQNSKTHERWISWLFRFLTHCFLGLIFTWKKKKKKKTVLSCLPRGSWEHVCHQHSPTGSCSLLFNLEQADPASVNVPTCSAASSGSGLHFPLGLCQSRKRVSFTPPPPCLSHYLFSLLSFAGSLRCHKKS